MKKARIHLMMTYDDASCLWWWLEGELNASDETQEKKIVRSVNLRLGDLINKADDKMAQQEQS